MKIDMLRAAIAVATAVTLSGCASIVKGQSQTIAITTPPTMGATCKLTSKQGTWTVVSPGPVTIERSKENVEIRCNKPGFQEGYSVIPSTFESWTVGNVLIGGIVGLGIDAATGAINQYPNAFQVPMYQLPPESTPQSTSAIVNPTS